VSGKRVLARNETDRTGKGEETMKKITIRNKFHNTEATLVPSKIQEVEQGHEHVIFATLSDSQVRRADKVLCGMKDCKCGGIHAAGEQTNSAGTEWIFPVIE
jgi:hypothetical protein